MNKFPAALGTLREKYPIDTLIQARITRESGSVVEFQGILDGPDDQFDRLLSALRDEDKDVSKKE